VKKRILSALFVLALVLAGTAGMAANTVAAVDGNGFWIKTPNETKIWCFKDLPNWSQLEIEILNNYYETNYPNAILVDDASKVYNCHSFAWHQQSPSNRYWINNPHQQNYWTDGSYTWCDPDFGLASKVRYVSDNHSAVKLDDPYHMSKWGQGPVMIHEWNDTPYDESTLYYYYRI
jgi:hypothetical protein